MSASRLRRAVDPLATARFLLREGRRQGTPVVILSPGKSGSTAIDATLSALLPDRPVYKVHWLSSAAVARSKATYETTPHHLKASHHLRRHLPTPEHPWDVVVPIREPVARNVAAFFQIGERRGHTLDDPERTVSELLAWHEWRGVTGWFDSEVRDTIGVDVLAHPFSPEAGHAIVRTDAVRMLVVRFEDLHVAPAALSRLLGTEVPALVRANTGAAKGYAEHYRRFTREARFPAAALDELYGSRYARHFYSDEEIAGFRARWS